MPILPIVEYAPDQPDLMGDGTDGVLNVLPRTKASYGPFPSLVAQASALNARCQGGIAVQDQDGNVHLFAGDATKLYHLPVGGTSWSDVSKLGGYTTGAGERWCFEVFGTRVIATNFSDPPQSFDLSSSTAFADLITSGTTSLRARYVAVVRDWVVFANTYDSTDGNRPQRVWWSAINDARTFPTPGTTAAAIVQSDFSDALGDWGWIQGIAGGLGSADGVLMFERAVFRLVYQGPPITFAILQAENVRGTPSPGSLIKLGTILFYLGEDGFYAFDGAKSSAIGAGKVDKSFMQDIDQATFYRVCGTVDPINKLVMFGYCAAGHSGNPSRILCYNWELDRWSSSNPGDLNFETLLQTLSIGYTLDGLDAVSTNLDIGFSVSFDSRIWTGGRRLLTAFDVTHKMAYFTGPALAASVAFRELQLVPGKRASVSLARPITDTSAATVELGTRERESDAVTWRGAVSQQASGACPQRAGGRYHQARVAIPAGTSWTDISGVELDGIAPDGGR